MSKVFSYERVSSRHQAEQGRGLERQADLAEAWCQARKLQLDASLNLSDPGRSAFHGDNISKGALGQFLTLAQKGELGEEPTLLVEGVDRLSRQEPLDGLQEVLLALVSAGVTIVSLEDEQEYSRATLREDSTKLIVLALKAQAAYEYSRRLSRRVGASWVQTGADLEEGTLSRIGVFMPPWCRQTDETIELIPERAAIVRRVFEMALTDGDQVVSTRLNEERVPCITGRPLWTRSSVKNLLIDARVWGAIRTNRKDSLNAKRRKQLAGKVKEEKTFPDLLPLVLTKERVDQTLAARSARTHPGAGRGKRGTMWNIASGLTRCGCGAAASVNATNSRSKKRDAEGRPLVLRYLKCRELCGAKAFRLEHVNAHVLTRLHAGQLQQLLAQDTERGARIRNEQKAIEVLQAQLIQAEQAQANAGRLFKEALLAGRDDPLYREAVEEARMETELKRAALSGAQQRLAGLRHEVDTQEFEAAVAELFNSFAKGEDTPAQRQELNRLLRRAGVTITLDDSTRRIGMAIGDGPIEWQPFDPITIQVALSSGTTSARYTDMTITDEIIEKTAAFDDNPGYIEWMKSMKGVPLTSVTSLPPGWEDKEIGKSMKEFVRSTIRENPEFAELMAAMNGQNMTAKEMQENLDRYEAKEKASSDLGGTPTGADADVNGKGHS